MLVAILKVISYLIPILLLIFSVALVTTYFLLALFSTFEIRNYLKKNSFIDYRDILTSPIAPSISLLAPAYNEGMSIVQNVRSLLSLHYGNFEVIIINDGSKDDTLIKLIQAYDLEPVNFAVNPQLLSKPIKNIYKSRNPSFQMLSVVDKINGGKADALNAGINVSKNDLIAAIDVDCIIEEDALLKMAKPFLEQDEKKVIATGGVIRIANSCVVTDGRITETRLPFKFLPRVQVLEYIRSFLLGRMAWSRLNGLIIISGAFGMFDKKVAIEAGGYNHNTVGEDMELVVRMRKTVHKKGIKYTVVYIPDPLCWTEAPENLKILGRQRNRWTRGTVETLFEHTELFVNPYYGRFGLLSYTYWFFFEWLAPIIELSGLLYLILQLLVGNVYWLFFIALFIAMYGFALFFSALSILAEELSFHQYGRIRDMFRLVITAFLEPLFFHPLTVFWSLKGNLDLLMGKKNWGVMVRTGFNPQTKNQS